MTFQTGDYLGRPSSIARDLKCGGGRQERGSGTGSIEAAGFDGAGRGPKPRDAGSSQGPRGKQMDCSLEPPKGDTALPTPDFQPRETCSELLTDRTVR